MPLKNSNISKFFQIILAVSFYSQINAVEMVVELDSETLSLEITPQDSLMEVFESLQNYQTDKCANFRYWSLDVSGDKIIAKSVKNLDEPPRDYYNSLKANDKKDIGFILKTLANTSIFKVMAHKGELERAGERVEHVHPLQFLYTIFSDEELKVCIRNLQGKDWVWDDFLEGITTSLKKENDAENLKSEYIKDFAHQLNIDPKIISAPIKKQEWKKVVDNLIEHVPRTGDINRYDQ